MNELRDCAEQLQAGWERECQDGDKILALFPELRRTEGGSLPVAKLINAICDQSAKLKNVEEDLVRYRRMWNEARRLANACRSVPMTDSDAICYLTDLSNKLRKAEADRAALSIALGDARKLNDMTKAELAALNRIVKQQQANMDAAILVAKAPLEEELAALRPVVDAVMKHAQVVIDLLELGDTRLMASDGPCGGQLPDLNPKEWGKVYRACKKIAALAKREEGGKI